MKKPMFVALLGAVALPAIWAAQSFAHHSFAMFDLQKRIEVKGTVKEFRWTNPHSWLVMTTQDKANKAVEFNIEMNGPGYLVRNGWKRESLKPGDVITATINPLRDGSAGGNLVTVILPDGSELSAAVRMAAPPGGGPVPGPELLMPPTGERR